MTVRRILSRSRSLLSAFGTAVVLILALLLIRGGFGPTTPDTRRWTFIEGDGPEALGLRIEAPRAGVWTLANIDHATGARALVSAVGDADAGAGLAIASNSFARDVVVSTRCRTVATHPQRACGVVLRHVDAGTFYVARADEARNKVEIVRSSAGVERVLGAAPIRAHEGWREIVFEARGPALGVTVDGVHALDVVDSAISAGNVGLWAAAQCEAYFDELSMRKLHERAAEALPLLQLGS